MKNIKALRDLHEKNGSPACELGDFLLSHSNGPEYLVSNLRRYLAAAESDLEAEQRFASGISHLIGK